jgi:hypothetical protein
MAQGFAGWLFGLKESELEHLSDDRIGRALDRLFDADRAALLTAIYSQTRLADSFCSPPIRNAVSIRSPHAQSTVFA